MENRSYSPPSGKTIYDCPIQLQPYIINVSGDGWHVTRLMHSRPTEGKTAGAGQKLGFKDLQDINQHLQPLIQNSLNWLTIIA